MNNEIKIAAELTLRRLQAEPGANTESIAAVFEPLLAAIASAEKQKRTYETKG